MTIDYKEIKKYLEKQQGGKVINNIKNKNNLENRIVIYKNVIKILSKLSNYECLEKLRDENYKINDIIYLLKKIGSKSRYGIIYLSEIVDKFKKYLMVSKVMKSDESNKNEIYIMKKITENVLLKNKSKHFIFLYKFFICEKRVFQSSKRLLSINELASGDIKQLFENRNILNNDELLMNLFFQTFISIATLHNLVNYVHKDTHYGNFLYMENSEIGYYHYIFKKKNYYLKSCEYNIMIYDFGFSQNIDNYSLIPKHNNNISLDYTRISNAYLNKKYGWGEHYDLPKIQFNNNILRIIKILENTSYFNQSDYFDKIIQNIFIPYAPKDMFLKERPINVINLKPFNID